MAHGLIGRRFAAEHGSTASPTMIERREYKYLIDNETAARVRRAIAPFCQLDPFALRSADRRYAIDTMYFDTPALSLFWANDLELVDRMKIRIRSYANTADSPVFFEVKRRVNDVIAKSRGRVPRALFQTLLTDDSMPIPDAVTGKDRVAVERFLALSRSMHVRPFTLVRYEREPYFSTIDDYARVTFDTRIRAQSVDRPTFDPVAGRWRALDDAVLQHEMSSLTVLELKFTNHVPLWLVNIVRNLGLTRGAFSKYGTSIRAFYEGVEARVPAGGWR